MESYVKLLSGVALFNGVAEKEIQGMLQCLNAHMRDFVSGSMIYFTGQKISSLGIVLEGNVQVVREDVHGNRMILAEWGPRDLFAEAYAPADVEEIPVSVFASGRSRVLFLDYKRIVTQCGSHCAFHSVLIRNMIRILAQKNIILSGRIDILGKRSIREKLLAYFWSQSMKSKNGRISIPFNRSELADYLCVDRSAMSRVLGQLQRQGILKSKKNVFELHIEE